VLEELRERPKVVAAVPDLAPTRAEPTVGSSKRVLLGAVLGLVVVGLALSTYAMFTREASVSKDATHEASVPLLEPEPPAAVEPDRRPAEPGRNPLFDSVPTAEPPEPPTVEAPSPETPESKQRAEPKRRVEPKEVVSAPSIDCAEIDRAVEEARASRSWARLVALTTRTNVGCWPGRAAWTRDRVLALYKSGDYERCRKLAEGSTDPQVSRYASLCEAKQDR
jgi:type IV secretory pathway VirB10-like protein